MKNRPSDPVPMALVEIAQTLGSRPELEQLLKQIAQQAARACKMQRCSIFLWEDERVVPVAFQYADGRVDQALGEAFQGLGRMRVQDIPFFAETVRRREPVVINCAAGDPLVPAAMKVFQFKAVLAVPLVRQGKPVGILVLDDTGARRPVTRETVALGVTIASQVALAVDNARLGEQAEKARAELQAIQNQLPQSEELRALGEMAGGVAHDFNNLLTAILGRAQFLLFQFEEGEVPPAEAQRNLAVIEQAAIDGAQTVRRLLESSRSRASGRDGSGGEGSWMHSLSGKEWGSP